ncbi:MAG: ferritin-like domain-containing protein [Myxococcales bacterium]|nr:ferritin-like domain-containing protein [Myxococcales bacterium]
MIVREAWAFRARVEREAAFRFARLAEEISAFDPDSPVPAMMRKAAEDERRHLALCEELAGGPVEGIAGSDRIAPRSLGPREAALYETVAACCITETESVATVTSLLSEDALPRVREVLHEIARDEVSHSRMGWAHLAREAGELEVGFLSRWLPSMLAGAAGSAFEPFEAEMDSPELLRHGVLPISRKRSTFVHTLREVVFPGLEQFGISTDAARAWLSERSPAAGGAGLR